ncbi:MAG: hypothetical protein J5716_06495 [Alphaproteobacteria bacterium]|nr:hypothetical protein [Alphaproteobacteria bacterium]
MSYTTGLVRFNVGEISELMSGRIDTEEYKGACKVLKNFIPSVQGPVSRRGGTRFVAEVKNSAKKTRLFAFQYSAVLSYLLEFGDHYVRFFYHRNPIVDQNDDPIEITVPYAAEDLDKLYFSQSGDVVYIAHPSYPLRTITRYGQTDWRTAEVELVDGPYLPIHTGDISLTPSATQGNITITASAAVFSATDVGRQVRIMQASNPNVQWGAAKITAYTSSTNVQATVLANYPFMNTTASKAWRLGVFSGTTGYPSAVTFFEQRLILGKGNGVYGSKTGQYEIFSPSATDASVTAECGYGYELSSDQINDVCWLSSGRALAIGTVGADFTLETVGGEGSIPMSVKAQRHSTYGSENVAPLKVGSTTLFVQHYGRKLRAFMYESNTDDYIAKDLTMLAPHMTYSGIKEMALQQEPSSIVWCALNNGGLVGLTYEAAESVQAWHCHELAEGFVESVATVPSENGGYDELFLLVRRKINGITKRYIEVMEKGIDEEAVDTKECFFVDSGLSYHGTAVSGVAGLDHLEGETVAVLADGAVQTEKVVANGQISLDTPASVIHVGLPFSSVMQTMPLTGIGQNGVSEESKKRISGLVLRLYKTLGFLIGCDNDVEAQSFRNTGDVMNAPPALFSGDKKVAFRGKWDRVSSIRIEQNQPLPLTVLGIFPVVSANKV